MRSICKFSLSALMPVIFIIATAASCHPASQPRRPNPEAPNIIIISMNAMRQDHLGCYGYRRPTSPNIDKLALESIVFSNAIAQSSHPLGSNASILTGLYLPSHGLSGLQVKLSGERTTLAEALRQYGYQTAAFTGGFHVSSIYGLNQGFDTYFDGVEHGRLEDTIPRSLEWLKNRPMDGALDPMAPRRHKKPFFLFLQAYDCHSPHKVPVEYEHIYDPDYKGIIDKFIMSHYLGNRISGQSLKTEQDKIIQLSADDINHIIAHYDGALTYADKQLGAFFDELEKMGLTGNSIVIFLGDHGEAHLDHGCIIRRQHGGIYEEGIKVPLIIRLPPALKSTLRIPQSPSQIDTQVQLIDLMPTILDYLNIPAPHPCQGRSVKSLVEGTTPDNPDNFAFSNGATNIPRPYDKLISIFPKPKSYMIEEWQACIRSNNWKLLKFNNINGTSYEFYNLKDDPKEKNNLIDKETRIAAELKDLLDQWEKNTLETMPMIEYNAALYNKIREKWRIINPWWLDDMDDGGDVFEPESLQNRSNRQPENHSPNSDNK